jgi:hypothetical protein
MTMARPLLAAAVVAALSAPSAPAFAFRASNPSYCTNQVTCTGGEPSATSNNGRTQHPEVVIMFWQDGSNLPDGQGSQWETGNSLSNDPTRSTLIGSSVSLVNTAYFASLQQYGIRAGFPGFVGRPRLAPFAPIVTGTPKNSGSGTSTSSFFLSDISNVILQEIESGAVPPPSGADDIIYLVFLPQASPGTRSTLCNGAGGCNYSGDNGCTHGATQISCGYVVAGDASGATEQFSRTVADAIAAYQDVTVNNCVYHDGASGTPSQISDVCQCFTENQNTFAVAPYWSSEDGACVTPESWGGLDENQNSGNGWLAPAGSFPIRQGYGGGGGVVATNTVENGNLGNSAYFYPDDGNGKWNGHCERLALHGCASWVADPIGNGGAEFAGGGGGTSAIVAGMTLDAKYGVNVYPAGKGAGQSWTAYGTPGDDVTSVNVTQDGWVVVTDTRGTPYYWRSAGGWQSFGGPGDQFIAFGDGIIGLTVDRGAMYFCPSSQFAAGTTSCAWQSFGNDFGDCARMIGGPDVGHWLCNVAGNTNYFGDGYNLGETGLFDVTGYQNGSAGGYAAINIEYGAFACDGQSNCYSGPFSTLSAKVGRLIPGASVYATTCADGQLMCDRY